MGNWVNINERFYSEGNWLVSSDELWRSCRASVWDATCINLACSVGCSGGARVWRVEDAGLAGACL